jgi:hypothetical protein
MKTRWLVIFLAGSIIIHLTVVFFVQFGVSAKGVPVIYGWPDIVNSCDLFSANPQVEPSKQFIFSLDEVRHNYFSRSSDDLVTANAALPDVSLPLPRFTQEPSPHEVALAGSDSAYFYLWEQPTLLTRQEPERASYRIFVSKQGKILFIYPDKLTSDASGALRVQEYIRSASFFLNKSFFWTNVEGVVK